MNQTVSKYYNEDGTVSHYEVDGGPEGFMTVYPGVRGATVAFKREVAVCFLRKHLLTDLLEEIEGMRAAA